MKYLALIIIIALTGCVQRIVEYNPDTGYWRYKSNSFASDTQADRIKIVTPSGIVIEIDKAYVNNDSFTFRFNPATRQIEVVTESGE
jgi:hypothetical protein